jgi:tRNA pseudouridine32 synthase / 23S rRNA pseudouridine746 synthase
MVNWTEQFHNRQPAPEPANGENDLPRTAAVEAIAQSLMQQFAADPTHPRQGKMYGVLLAQNAAGQPQVLKAFSGLLQGQSQVAGWVPPIPGRDRVALNETQTLAELERMKQQLLMLQQHPAPQQYAAMAERFSQQLQTLNLELAARKQQRQQQRQQAHLTLEGTVLAARLAELDAQSQADGIRKRNLKRERDRGLKPLQAECDRRTQQIADLKQQRKHRSQQLQVQLHAAYSLTNFAGQSLSLMDLVLGQGIPTGTGDCCAPKLLHYAATHGLKPVALAEFWWGSPSADGSKQSGQFYPPCAERCQPILPFLLAGFAPAPDSPILYEDEWLLAIAKPAGLLSVPGRTGDRQDSVLSRLRRHTPQGIFLPVHRLDQDTSGVLLIAKDRQTHRQVSQQFAQQQVHKIYEAIVAGDIAQPHGTISLPLWGDPNHRPHQTVDWQRGKPSHTQFQVLETTPPKMEGCTRVEFRPLSGRTHQLRVHAAHPKGLNAAIVGDRLYGSGWADGAGDRLYLHARELQFHHPQQGALCLQVAAPF